MNDVGRNCGGYVVPCLAAGVVAVGVLADKPLDVASRVLSVSLTAVQTVALGALNCMSWVDDNPTTSLPLAVIAGGLALAFSAGNDLDHKPKRQFSAFCKLAIVAVIIPLATMKLVDPNRPFFTQTN
jgi:hypothetical protein